MVSIDFYLSSKHLFFKERRTMFCMFLFVLQNSMPILEEPLQNSAVQPSRKENKKKNGQLLSLSTDESSTAPTQPQPPAEPCGTDEQPERNEEESTVQPQEEAEGPTRMGEKRREESEQTTDGSTAAKRVCFEPGAQASSKTSSESAAREFKDVSSVGDCLQRDRREEEPESLMDEDIMESSGDEIIDVDGPTHFVKLKPPVSPSLLSTKEVRLGSTGSWEDDEDIDVIGGSSPAPDPVIITWTESSEGEDEEDEDVDVVGEKTDYASSDVFITVSTAELVNRKYQTAVLLH